MNIYIFSFFSTNFFLLKLVLIWVDFKRNSSGKTGVYEYIPHGLMIILNDYTLWLMIIINIVGRLQPDV